MVRAGQQALNPLPVLAKDIQAVPPQVPVLVHTLQCCPLLLFNPGHCLTLEILQSFPQLGEFALNPSFELLRAVLGRKSHENQRAPTHRPAQGGCSVTLILCVCTSSSFIATSILSDSSWAFSRDSCKKVCEGRHQHGVVILGKDLQDHRVQPMTEHSNKPRALSFMSSHFSQLCPAAHPVEQPSAAHPALRTLSGLQDKANREGGSWGRGLCVRITKK